MHSLCQTPLVSRSTGCSPGSRTSGPWARFHFFFHVLFCFCLEYPCLFWGTLFTCSSPLFQIPSHTWPVSLIYVTCLAPPGESVTPQARPNHVLWLIRPLHCPQDPSQPPDSSHLCPSTAPPSPPPHAHIPGVLTGPFLGVPHS